MPQTPHIETHFTASGTVRDIVIGMSDGLTVPFALAAGLSGAVTATSIVVTAGLAEIAAGAIAMGLGGFLAARSDAEHYASEKAREQLEVRDMPEEEEKEVREVLGTYGLSGEEAEPIVAALRRKPGAWVDFMMRFELGLEKPDPSRARTSGLTIAGAYVAGGLIPLSPYLFLANVRSGLSVSIALTILALALFGYIKGHYTGARPWTSSMQTTLIGGVAAAAAFGIARWIS
jgi:VIT1/CCC1 family predicted Fe2+/Mn2+ transporter